MPARTAPAGPVDIAVIGFVDERPDQKVAAVIADAVASGAAGAVNGAMQRLERLAALQQQGILPRSSPRRRRRSSPPDPGPDT